MIEQRNITARITICVARIVEAIVNEHVAERPGAFVAMPYVLLARHAPNENKMSRRERGRASQRIDRLKPRKAEWYGGSRSAPSTG